MKKILLTIVALTTLAATTQAALIAHWGFDSYTSGDFGPVSPEDGLQLTANITIDPAVPANKLNSVAGTTLNDPRVTPSASQAVSFKGPHANSGFITIHLSGTGLSTFFLTYAAQRTQSGPHDNHWSYSIDGGTTFTDVGVGQMPVDSITSTYSIQTINFAGITALDGAADILLHGTFVTNPGGGSADYDNFQILASIPEPVNVALALFGIGIVGLKFGRRLFSFVRR